MPSTCTTEGCETPAHSKGLCNKHYLRAHYQANLDKERARGREKSRQRRANPITREADIAVKRHKRTGFSPQLVIALRELQGGKCAMPGCDVVLGAGRYHKGTEAADHDHATGEPRGLLCSGCNQHLGSYEKMKAWGAEEYLALPPVKRLRRPV